MRKIDKYIGTELDQVLLNLKIESKSCNEDCYIDFNGKEVYSTDTLDEAYIKVCGCSYGEHKKRVQEWLYQREREAEEFKSKIPEFTEHYRNEARGVILEEDLEYWDKIVPIRLGDLYRGYELRCTLDIVRIMKRVSTPLGDRLNDAKCEFERQNHSGMSAGLMFSMLSRFCPNGEELVNSLRNG